MHKELIDMDIKTITLLILAVLLSFIIWRMVSKAEFILFLVTLVLAEVTYFTTGWFMFSAMFSTAIYILIFLYLENKQKIFCDKKFNDENNN